MAESQNTQALIIKRHDWREHDSRVVLYTKRFGKVSLVARGVKKIKSKIAAHVEPLSLADIMILKGKVFDYLGSSLITKSHLNIKSDLNALYFAGRSLGVFDNLVKEGVPDEELFDFLIYYFDFLDNLASGGLKKEAGEDFFSYFIFQILAILGYKPELYHCLSCKRKIEPTGNSFNFRLGGLICPHCLGDNKQRFNPNEISAISADCIKIIRIFSEKKAYQNIRISHNLAKEISRLAKVYLDFI